jgi:predicted trehalose synthase
LVDVAGLMRSFDYAVATTLDPKKLAGAPLPETGAQ